MRYEMAVPLLGWLATSARADWPVQSLTSPPDPVGVALADVDGDGTTDVVIADGGGTVVWTTPGGGVTPIASWSALTTVAVLDADQDGDVDVLVGSLRGPGVRWYENGGGGASWTPKDPSSPLMAVVSVDGGILGTDATPSIAVGSNQRIMTYQADPFTQTMTSPEPSRVLVVDLDGDRRLDVVALDPTTGAVRWWRSGPWENPDVVVTTLPGTTSIDVVDLDRDRLPELVLGSSTGGLATVRSLGHGRFDAPHTWASGLSGLVATGAADLDGDGDLDLLGAARGEDRVVWLEGAGDGTFAPPQTLAVVPGPVDLATLPFQGSGPDIPVAATGGAVLLRSPGFADSDGDGLADGVETTFGSDPARPDSDGDGLPDWLEVVRGLDPTNHDSDGGGIPDGEEALAGHDPGDRRDDWVSSPLALGGTCTALHVVDVDGDRIPDVLHGTDGIAWRRGLGGGRLGPDEVLQPTNGPLRWRVGDVDGDGHPDIVASGADGVTVWTHLTPGPPSATLLDTWPAAGMALADLDEDGDPEILLAAATRRIHAWWRGADGTWTSTVLSVLGDGLLALADLDGDGHDDLVAQDGRSLLWAVGDGHGAFGSTVRLETGGGTPTTLQVADLDNDGRPDVVAGTGASHVAVLWNDGASAFTLAPLPTDASWVDLIDVRDVDGDALPDLVIGDKLDGGSTLGWRRNDGARGFEDPVPIATSIGVLEALSTGDIDGDGDADVVSCSSSDAWIAASGAVADRDHDGLSDTYEQTVGTSALQADTDGGGTPDGEELGWGTDPLDPTDDLAMDRDHDGLSDAEELAAGTDPYGFDTDGDTIADGRELDLGIDPRSADSDGDGMADGAELECASDPLDAGDLDTDCDGLSDAEEAVLGTDPTSPDTDGDGLSDATEVDLGTNPLDADTDHGGTNDLEESQTDRDPHDPADDWAYHAVVAGSEAHGPLALFDADGDGDLDLWIAMTTGHVAWIERLEDGRFGSTRIVWQAEQAVRSLAGIDIDGDGGEDLLVVGPEASNTWLVGEHGSYAPVVPTTRQASLVASGDFDDDGDTDLLAADADACWSWLANGGLVDGWTEHEWWWRDPVALVAAPPGGYLVADDALYAVRDGTDPNGFELVTAGDVGSQLAPADLDGDGWDDVVYQHRKTRVLNAVEHRDQGWSRPRELVELPRRPKALASIQVDASGPSELIVGTSEGPLLVWTDPVRLTSLGDRQADRILVTDVDGDGAPDVITAGTQGVGWYRNGFVAPTAEPTGEPTGDTGTPERPRHHHRKDEGCGCVSGPRAPSAGLWIALLAWRRRRRHR